MALLRLHNLRTYSETTASSPSTTSGSVTLSSSISPHPLFSSPPAALHPSAKHRYLFRNLSVEIILHLRRSLSTHNYHEQSCRTVLNSAETLMTLLTACCKARLLLEVACCTPALNLFLFTHPLWLGILIYLSRISFKPGSPPHKALSWGRGPLQPDRTPPMMLS